MNRRVLIAIGTLVAAGVGWWVYSPAEGKGRPTPVAEGSASHPPEPARAAAPAELEVRAKLEELAGQLSRAATPDVGRLALAELRRWLDQLPPEIASTAIQSFLATGGDAATRLDIAIERDGSLREASSLRVFLMDYLGRIDRPAAGRIAAQVLAAYTTPDEWAVSLRNYAWANPGPDAAGWLQAKSRELLANAAWAGNPSAGYLEAFDTIVYARGTALVPELAAFARDGGNRATAHAAFLTLDRLAIAAPAATLQQLVEQPGLMATREQSRAGLMARGDVRDPAQRALVERYLLDPARDPAELAAFAGIFPNANFMVSNNLLTTVTTPTGDQIAAGDRAALQAIEQWQADPRYAGLQPLLASMHDRVAQFVRPAPGAAP